jgi:hypothetical protein
LERRFRARNAGRGLVAPRGRLLGGAAERATLDALDDLNFGEATAAPAPRRRVRVYDADGAFAGWHRDVYAYDGGRGMFLSNVERNRLAHALNGNTTPQ